MKMYGWGKYPETEATVIRPSTDKELLNLSIGADISYGFTPRGLGRSYGDSSLGKKMVETLPLNHMLSFDEQTGIVHCQSGVSLADILEVFVPRGWFLPVTPGTKYVTVGGAIASDIHGKNHHVDGCFCDHVDFFDLFTGSGDNIRCSLLEHPELFRATCGGMGLTGIILSAAIRLKPVKSAYIEQITYKSANLKQSLELFEKHSDKPYSVAWIDCIASGGTLGRSLLMTGKHAEHGKLHTHRDSRISVPVDLPSFILNPFSVRAFNTLYYNKVRQQETHATVHYDPFFYPLDGIGNWNRMYGKNGFTQYQFVVPKDGGLQAMHSILRTIVASKKGSFLAVLKAFGKKNNNLLSFPMEGYTLALDFKIEPDLFPLLDRLDAMVLDYGGRLYLTKDSRMSSETFKRCYPFWEQFQNIRDRYGVHHTFLSMQSQRLGLDS